MYIQELKVTAAFIFTPTPQDCLFLPLSALRREAVSASHSSCLHEGTPEATVRLFWSKKNVQWQKMITSAPSSNTTLGEKIRRWGRDKIFMRMAAMSPCTNWPNYLYKCTNTHRFASCILVLKYWCLGIAEISVCGCRLVHRLLCHYLQPNYLISGAFFWQLWDMGGKYLLPPAEDLLCRLWVKKHCPTHRQWFMHAWDGT